MKKIFFLTTVFIICFSGCSSKESEPTYDVDPSLQQKNAKEALKEL